MHLDYNRAAGSKGVTNAIGGDGVFSDWLQPERQSGYLAQFGVLLRLQPDHPWVWDFQLDIYTGSPYSLMHTSVWHQLSNGCPAWGHVETIPLRNGGSKGQCISGTLTRVKLLFKYGQVGVANEELETKVLVTDFHLPVMRERTLLLGRNVFNKVVYAFHQKNTDWVDFRNERSSHYFFRHSVDDHCPISGDRCTA